MTDSKNIKIAIVLVTSLFFLWGVSYGVGGKIKCNHRKIK